LPLSVRDAELRLNCSALSGISWQLHLSTALLLEYEAVAVREAQNFWLRPDLVEDVLDYLCANAQEHAISFRWRPFLGDPKLSEAS